MCVWLEAFRLGRVPPLIRPPLAATFPRRGKVMAPLAGRASLRLTGERIATPACALVRNDRLGSAVGLEAAGRFREADGGGEPPPYGTGFGDASGPTHPAPIMHP